MGHYAFINKNTMRVVEVIKGRDEDDLENLPTGFDDWEKYYETKRNNLLCKRTSYNTAQNQHLNEDGELSDTQEKTFRGNYAGIGMLYDQDNDVFLYDPPFASWIMNESTWTWEAPVDKPDLTEEEAANSYYVWNEDTTSWDLTEKDS